LPSYDAGVLTEAKETALWFLDLCEKTSNYKAASNWMMGPIKSYLNEKNLNIVDLPISTDTLAQLIELIDDNKVSFTVAAQSIYPELLQSASETPIQIAQRLNLIQESDEDSLMLVVEAVLEENQAKVKEYRSGKKGLMGMFMGQVMQKSNGKADPKVATKLLIEILEG
jgi:aspartyl-tRNA(Asn)/glutamyl-tRNA(Gln) amidotransferase subunit B